ncbi:amidase domain-containing protein [Alicyclobacillus shizuokensis]|uniref:amidase domain-containing protein n=1 Tax=Alicyclobacillus shizuokensis TaxID=392014 RepID=UPI003571468A
MVVILRTLTIVLISRHKVLHAGGLPEQVYRNINTGLPVTTSNDHYWFYQDGQRSYSWSVSWDLYTYLLTYSGDAKSAGTYSGDIGNNQYNTLSKGDIIGYNWGDSSEPITHVAVEVGYGTDPDSGWVGDYVDAHTTNHKHAYWTLQPYNSKASTTKVKTISITY